MRQGSDHRAGKDSGVRGDRGAQARSNSIDGTQPAGFHERVFMHYTASRKITEEDIEKYGNWEKAFKAIEAEREEELVVHRQS